VIVIQRATPPWGGVGSWASPAAQTLGDVAVMAALAALYSPAAPPWLFLLAGCRSVP